MRDGFVLVPLVLAILAIALYPQFALERSEKTVSALAPSGLAERRGRDPGGLAMISAAAKVAGPDIDWAGLSPLIAVLGGALLVLMLGLLRSRAIRETAVPALSIAEPRDRDRPVDLAVGRAHATSSPARCASTS